MAEDIAVEDQEGDEAEEIHDGNEKSLDGAVRADNG